MINKIKNYKIKSKYTNNKKNLVITQIKKGNNIEATRHFPPSTVSWFNSMYFFNKNVVKNSLSVDVIVNKTIKMYFNLISNVGIKKGFIRRRSKFRNSSTNRIFVSRADIKHYNDKIIITLYTFNKAKINLLKKLLTVYKEIFNLEKQETNVPYYVNNYNGNDKDNILRSLFNKIIDNDNPSSKILYVLYNKFKFINIKCNILLNFFYKKNLIFFMKFIKNSSSYTTFEYKYLYRFKKLREKFNKKLVRNIMKKELLYLRYNKWLMTNSYKYNNIYLYRLSQLLSTIYAKKVEFDIVNLKYPQLDINILLNSIKIKMKKNRKYRPILILRKALLSLAINKSKSYNYNIQKIYKENYNKLNLKFINYKSNENDILNLILNRIYKINNSINSGYKYKYVFRSIKLRELMGIRLKAKGRITRRLTAARSVTKIYYKGSIRNIDSSINGLSAVLIKNYLRSNVDYLNINSKTRNGSFGLRGWISSK